MENEIETTPLEESGETSVDKNVEVVKRFKKCYKEFIRDFCKSFPEYSNRAKEVYFNIDNWYEFISTFIENLEPHITSISKKDESIFLENRLTIIDGLDSEAIWRDTPKKNREVIWKYLHTLYILGITYKGEVGDLVKIIENINNLDNEDLISNLNNQAKIMVDMFKNISMNKNEEQPDESVDAEDNEDTEPKHEDKKGKGHTTGLEDMLQNSKIADLAKELSEEINLDDNFTDPSEIMNNLTGDPTKMFDLIKVIGGKIQNKISTGDLNESELLDEAQNMFLKISKNNNLFNNDIFKKMASTMSKGAGGAGGAGGMPDIANMASMMSGMFNDDSSRVDKRNDRLKKKLAEKKKFMESLEKKAQELNLNGESSSSSLHTPLLLDDSNRNSKKNNKKK